MCMHTHALWGPHTCPKRLEYRSTQAGFWPRCRKVHRLLWVMSVKISREQDRSNLQFPRNCAWYFATPCPFCRGRVKGLKMAPARELPLASLERGEGTKPSALRQKTAHTPLWVFSTSPGSGDPA